MHRLFFGCTGKCSSDAILNSFAYVKDFLTVLLEYIYLCKQYLYDNCSITLWIVSIVYKASVLLGHSQHFSQTFSLMLELCLMLLATYLLCSKLCLHNFVAIKYFYSIYLLMCFIIIIMFDQSSLMDTQNVSYYHNLLYNMWLHT